MKNEGATRNTTRTAKKTRRKRPGAPDTAEKRQLRTRAARILRRLRDAYPDAHCALRYQSPLDLYVATLLSAQCTDARVNLVTPALFSACRTPQDYLALGQERLEERIRSTGFFRAKARNILGGCRVILERFGGDIPDTMEELVQIPGVGRKTANVLLGEVFSTPGITVDTHVGRVARRLGLTEESDPVKVEFALQHLFPKKEWTRLSHLLIDHGRYCCHARLPHCPRCPIARDCPGCGSNSVARRT